MQANHKALETCVGPHDFVDQTPEKQIGKKWRCKACGGTLDGVERHWYEQGLKHGRAAP